MPSTVLVTYINSLNSYNNSMRAHFIKYLILQIKKLRDRKVKELLKITQLIHSRARIQNKEVGF